MKEALGGVGCREMSKAVGKGLRIRLRWIRIWVWMSEGARYVAGIGSKVKDQWELSFDILLRRRLVYVYF